MEEKLKELQDMNFKVVHLGINSSNEEEALSAAKFFITLFGFPMTDKKESVFAGPMIEIMKGNGRGTNGHIAISVKDVCKGKAYLEDMGYIFDANSEKYDSNGNLTLIYLKDEVAGFAIHLIKE
ncbi:MULTISPECIES: khg/kdpg family aldolase/carbohydrate kinase [Clostridium]|jgi:2-dehydro-3-deoxyphosphogluconate aldolase/(4S)-4-hydroxy-2-oxoglutarate aldolase|uniref:VOC family protein n=1 Tax=Clostridium TaxID=1485 RepID=UPI0002881F17|nr:MULTISPECIES: khg/kdpg family aldolase/carbohydrate kinase [Clostridium]MDF2505936.1 khg/kdpg family aldolase/carbohydrate kinase, pfkb family [Clostridium sp.]